MPGGDAQAWRPGWGFDWKISPASVPFLLPLVARAGLPHEPGSSSLDVSGGRRQPRVPCSTRGEGGAHVVEFYFYLFLNLLSFYILEYLQFHYQVIYSFHAATSGATRTPVCPPVTLNQLVSETHGWTVMGPLCVNLP